MKELIVQRRPRLLQAMNLLVEDEGLPVSLLGEFCRRIYKACQKVRRECGMHRSSPSVAIDPVRNVLPAKKFRVWRLPLRLKVGVRSLAYLPLFRPISADQEHLDRRQVEAVTRAILGLPSDQLAIVHMRFVQRMEMREIAKAMNMPSSMVKMHLLSAIRVMRNHVRSGQLGS